MGVLRPFLGSATWKTDFSGFSSFCLTEKEGGRSRGSPLFLMIKKKRALRVGELMVFGAR